MYSSCQVYKGLLLRIVYFKLAEPASYITDETVGFNLLGSYIDNKVRLMWEVGYLMVLHVRLGAKIGDWHAKDSNTFRKRQILLFFR